jgi:hypothetical protein
VRQPAPVQSQSQEETLQVSCLPRTSHGIQHPGSFIKVVFSPHI